MMFKILTKEREKELLFIFTGFWKKPVFLATFSRPRLLKQDFDNQEFRDRDFECLGVHTAVDSNLLNFDFRSFILRYSLSLNGIGELIDPTLGWRNINVNVICSSHNEWIKHFLLFREKYKEFDIQLIPTEKFDCLVSPRIRDSRVELESGDCYVKKDYYGNTFYLSPSKLGFTVTLTFLNDVARLTPGEKRTFAFNYWNRRNSVDSGMDFNIFLGFESWHSVEKTFEEYFRCLIKKEPNSRRKVLSSLQYKLSFAIHSIYKDRAPCVRNLKNYYNRFVDPTQRLDSWKEEIRDEVPVDIIIKDSPRNRDPLIEYLHKDPDYYNFEDNKIKPIYSKVNIKDQNNNPRGEFSFRKQITSKKLRKFITRKFSSFVKTNKNFKANKLISPSNINRILINRVIKVVDKQDRTIKGHSQFKFHKGFIGNEDISVDIDKLKSNLDFYSTKKGCMEIVHIKDFNQNMGLWSRILVYFKLTLDKSFYFINNVFRFRGFFNKNSDEEEKENLSWINYSNSLTKYKDISKNKKNYTLIDGLTRVENSKPVTIYYIPKVVSVKQGNEWFIFRFIPTKVFLERLHISKLKEGLYTCIIKGKFMEDQDNPYGFSVSQYKMLSCNFGVEYRQSKFDKIIQPIDFTIDYLNFEGCALQSATELYSVVINAINMKYHEYDPGTLEECILIFWLISPLENKKEVVKLDEEMVTKGLTRSTTKIKKAFKSHTLPLTLDENQYGKREFSTTICLINNRITSVEKNKIYNNTTHQKFSNNYNNQSLFNDIKSIIENNPHNSQTQLIIENLLLDYSYFVEQQKISSNRIHWQYTHNKLAEFLFPYEKELIFYIDRFIDKYPQYLIENLENEIELVKILKVVPIKQVCSIILGCYLRIINNEKFDLGSKNLHADIISDLGKSLIDLYFYTLCKNEKKYKFLSFWVKDNPMIVNKFKENPSIGPLMGGKMIEWLINMNLLKNQFTTIKGGRLKKTKTFNIIQSEDEYKSERFISSNENNSDQTTLFEFLRKLNFVSLPQRLPMITKPKPYTNKEIGGYLLNDEKYINELILNKPSLKEKSIILEDNIIYKNINNLNNVGFKINTDLMNFIIKNTQFYDNYLLTREFIDILSSKDKLTLKERIELDSYKSKFYLQENIWNIAIAYEKVSAFYLPCRMDSRGRIYCVTEYLNYQGHELSKALLLFSKITKISRVDTQSIYYLKLYGANLFSSLLNKKSGVTRLKWIESNLEDLQNFENGRLIKQSENKFLFTAFCIEFKKWLNFEQDSSCSYFYTNFPIQLDATCNGYQHLALLCLDNKAAQELNLTESKISDTPKDLYLYVTGHLRSHFSQELISLQSKIAFDDKHHNLNKKTREEILLSIPHYKKLIDFNFTRKLVKQLIMVIPYSATDLRLREYLEYYLVKLPSIKDDETDKWKLQFRVPTENTSLMDDPLILDQTDLGIIVLSIRLVLANIFPRIEILVKYLKKIASICTKLDLYIPWILPSGLEIKLSYMTEKTLDLKPYTHKKNTVSLTTFIKDKYNTEKLKRAFMANLIHSLDACTLIMLLDSFFSIKPRNMEDSYVIYPIHDCFVIPIDKVDILMDLLKVCYISIYSKKKYLLELDKTIRENIKLSYGKDVFTSDFEILISNNKKEIIINYPNVNEIVNSEFNFSSLEKSAYIVI